MSEKLEKIKEIQRITNAGIAQCKSALEEADGDLFQAVVKLLTLEDVEMIRSSAAVRASAGSSIKDPVTEEEAEFVDRLWDHFNPNPSTSRIQHTGYISSLVKVRRDEEEGLNEEDWDDTEDQEPPTHAEVCSRIMCLGALLWRTQLELNHSRNLAEIETLLERHAELEVWVKGSLESLLSQHESELLSLPFGAWSIEDINESVWRFEALAVLVWSTGGFDEMLPWTETSDGQTLMEKASLFGTLEQLKNSTALRDADEIEQVQHTAEFWNWRCRTEQLRVSGFTPPAGDSFDGAISRAVEHAANSGIVADTIDGDVSVNGTAFAKLDDQTLATIMSISHERHYAANWLCGYAPDNDWDQTRTDT